MPPLRIALAQLNVTVGELPGNQAQVAQAIHCAQAWQADLLVVPELALTGYPPEDLLLNPSFVADNQARLKSLAGDAKGVVALVGFVDRTRRGGLFNAAAVLANGTHLATYRKQCLPNYGVFDEKRYFTPGSGPLLLAVGGVHVAVMICEDLWETWPAEQAADHGAQLLVNLSASPYHAGKLGDRERLFAERARANRLAVVSCNLVGGQDELVFDGASLVLDAGGRVLVRGAQFQEDFLVVDLAPSQLGASRRRRAGILQIPRALRQRPPIPLKPARPLPRVEEVYEALTVGVRDYVRKNRFDTVVLGVSGGVDSSLTACVAVDALGPDRVVGVAMPSRFSSKATQDDAKQLAQALGIRCEELSIEPVFSAYLRTLKDLVRGSGGAVEVTVQNIQARIRGNLLMALSNRFGWLVLTTGNKSEMATGYTTLYGDMAGGFAVIKDVPKTLVYELARFRNRRGAGRPIPSAVLRRAPTAELARNQRDQDTLPPYYLLDSILKAYVEEDRGLGEILGHNWLRPQTVRRVVQLVDRAEYKRRQGPPGIKITPKAFGKDRRMPITNRYQQGE